MNWDALIENAKYVIELLAILGVVVEITPIKISPLKWIGNRLNGTMNDRIKKIEKELIEIRVQSQRNEILDFANSCRNGRRHTVEEFNNIMDIIQNYDDICKKYDWIKNGKTTQAVDYLKQLFYELSRRGEFEEKCGNGDLLHY